MKTMQIMNINDNKKMIFAYFIIISLVNIMISSLTINYVKVILRVETQRCS